MRATFASTYHMCMFFSFFSSQTHRHTDTHINYTHRHQHTHQHTHTHTHTQQFEAIPTSAFAALGAGAFAASGVALGEAFAALREASAGAFAFESAFALAGAFAFADAVTAFAAFVAPTSTWIAHDRVTVRALEKGQNT